jgi:multiple sugar transport system substrate-binding protein
MIRRRGVAWMKVVGCLIFGVLLAGCAQEEGVLTFAIGGAPNEVDYWQQLIHEFEGKNGMRVKIFRQPTDTDLRRQSLFTPLQAKKKDPDVFLMDVVWVAQFAASGWLAPLHPYVGKNIFESEILFEPVVGQVDRYGGQWIALPVYVDCGILYFRKDLLARYGLSPPETWEDLLHCAKLVQREEKKKNPLFYGFVWQGSQYEGLVCNFLEFITSNGGGILDAEGKIRVNREENRQALIFMRDLIHRYRISPENTFTEMKEEEVRTTFQNGNALFERNWPYAWKLHEGNDSPVRGKVGVKPLPRFKRNGSAAALGGWHMGISAYSDKKEEAGRLIRYLFSQPVQKKLALNLGWNPGRKDLYEDPELQQKLPHLTVLKRALESSVTRPSSPYYTQLSEIIQIFVNGALAGKIESGEALRKAQKELEKIEKAYHE